MDSAFLRKVSLFYAFMPQCMCVHQVCVVSLEDQKRASDCSGTGVACGCELYDVGYGNQAQVPWKSNQHS